MHVSQWIVVVLIIFIQFNEIQCFSCQRQNTGELCEMDDKPDANGNECIIVFDDPNDPNSINRNQLCTSENIRRLNPPTETPLPPPNTIRLPDETKPNQTSTNNIECRREKSRELCQIDDPPDRNGDNCVIVTDSENFRPMLCTRENADSQDIQRVSTESQSTKPTNGFVPPEESPQPENTKQPVFPPSSPAAVDHKDTPQPIPHNTGFGPANTFDSAEMAHTRSKHTSFNNNPGDNHNDISNHRTRKPTPSPPSPPLINTKDVILYLMISFGILLLICAAVAAITARERNKRKREQNEPEKRRKRADSFEIGSELVPLETPQTQQTNEIAPLTPDWDKPADFSNEGLACVEPPSHGLLVDESGLELFNGSVFDLQQQSEIDYTLFDDEKSNEEIVTINNDVSTSQPSSHTRVNKSRCQAKSSLPSNADLLSNRKSSSSETSVSSSSTTTKNNAPTKPKRKRAPKEHIQSEKAMASINSFMNSGRTAQLDYKTTVQPSATASTASSTAPSPSTQVYPPHVDNASTLLSNGSLHTASLLSNEFAPVIVTANNGQLQHIVHSPVLSSASSPITVNDEQNAQNITSPSQYISSSSSSSDNHSPRDDVNNVKNDFNTSKANRFCFDVVDQHNIVIPDTVDQINGFENIRPIAI